MTTPVLHGLRLFWATTSPCRRWDRRKGSEHVHFRAAALVAALSVARAALFPGLENGMSGERIHRGAAPGSLYPWGFVVPSSGQWGRGPVPAPDPRFQTLRR